MGAATELPPITSSDSYGRIVGGIETAYPGLPHGMPTTHAEQINADLHDFIKTG